MKASAMKASISISGRINSKVEISMESYDTMGRSTTNEGEEKLGGGASQDALTSLNDLQL